MSQQRRADEAGVVAELGGGDELGVVGVTDRVAAEVVVGGGRDSWCQVAAPAVIVSSCPSNPP